MSSSGSRVLVEVVGASANAHEDAITRVVADCAAIRVLFMFGLRFVGALSISPLFPNAETVNISAKLPFAIMPIYRGQRKQASRFS
jgi:hypothetical protein